LVVPSLQATAQKTYAEKLGWPAGARVVIFHVDDAGMSYSSNQGTVQSIEKGVATSCSIMMACPWAADFTKYAVANPAMDAGLHLTLTSEWQSYRWGPLSGRKQVPGLTDTEGAMWHSVEEVVSHATPDEIEAEIRAQLDRAISIGLKPTHLDSHMGTLFATPSFLERYIKVGIENKIPVMFPGGNNKMLLDPVIKKLKASGKWKDGMPLPPPYDQKKSAETGRKLWDAGLPVLDDLVTNSGDWKPESGSIAKSEEWTKYKVQKFKEVLGEMKPGLAMIIVHSSDITDTFQYISGSGGSRYADMKAMMDPDLKAYIKKNGIILTTWKEVMQRRIAAR
jgi:hypothetical protein